jgi:hypothetical protein
MVDYVRTGAVKEAVEARLLLYPGVHAVAIGPKITGGQRTEEPSIMVFLVRKRPLSELAPEEVVPSEIDGVKTDIIEMGVPRVAALDRERKRPLLGGIAVQPRGWEYWGTLGCFALTQDTPAKVVAITCQHVVDPPLAGPTSSVRATPVSSGPGNSFTFAFSIQGDTVAGSLVQVSLVDKTSPLLSQALFNAWWTVAPGETVQHIAKNVVRAVNAIPGGMASATIGQPPTNVVINVLQDNIQFLACHVWDPPVIDSSAALTASVSANVITLAGQADRDYCVYVTWNTNGGDGTQGVLTVVPKGTPTATATKAIAASVTSLSISGITGDSTEKTVTVNGAAQVNCGITDPRVGQPYDCFCSDCSACCGDEMGRVLRADVSTDAALVQVQRGLQYLNQIIAGSDPAGKDTLIRGARDLTPEDLSERQPFTVYKRGIASDYTSGSVLGLAMNGYITGDTLKGASTNATPLHRFYRNAMVIDGGATAFAISGDSGSAVVDGAGDVVGIVFGVAPNPSAQDPNAPKYGVATPIKQITDRLQVTIAESAQLDEPWPVSDAQGAPRAVLAADDQLTRALTTQAQLTATPTGKRYAEAITRHAREVQDLVNHNRRVTVAWHRNGGPQILRAAQQVAGQREDRLPQEIDGQPLAERLARIGDALARNGSQELAADLARYGAGLLELLSLSYDEALDRMRSSELTAADAE